MKLLRAEFQNFRLLRDLELPFASEPNKNLTVIRAANESGKTTILHALQWALYGDAALPDKGEGFRLHPIDWEASDGRRVPITATVEFEIATHQRMSGQLRETREQYRLIRTVAEDADGHGRRSPSTVKLFGLTERGASPINDPEALINEELPPELREVFFTDGDRTLSFIEAELSTKRERVQRAIRSLLGLSVIEALIKHVRRSEGEVNKKAKKLGNGGELSKITSDLEANEELCNKLEAELEDSKQQFSAFDEKVSETDSKITTTLQKGDKEKLKKDRENVGREIKRLDDQIMDASREHSALFRSRSIATALLAPSLNNAFKKLEELHEQGRIPNTTTPVLQNRLSVKLCICGETLEPNEPDGERRRAHIQKLIDDSQRADEVQEIVTELYYSARLSQTEENANSSGWLEDYKKVVKHRHEIQELRDEVGRKYRALEHELDALPDTDIQELRATLQQYKDQRDRCLSKRTKIETQIYDLRRYREELEKERDRLLREEKRGARIRAELDVTQDVRKVLQSSYEQITNDELGKVSKLMNSIFLEMIGADPEQGAIIQRAEIGLDFDIIVYGPNDKTLNPDRDLNGASRRALTLAFILALTKVSEVEAPNVIDTPLGMTSGYVKRSILKTAIRESAQLVLFLTHDEIVGCEDIIDETAGMVVTLTNPTHYPKMLVNDPIISGRKVLRCECDHRNDCQLCQRRMDAELDSEMTS